MTYYAWTIRPPGRPDIRRVTTLDGLHEVIRILDLPGDLPAEWLTMDPQGDLLSHGRYTHNGGGKDEWSLSWTEVDDAPV